MKIFPFALMGCLVSFCNGRRVREAFENTQGTQSNLSTGGVFLPDCSQKISIVEAVDMLSKWCDPATVEEQFRAPEKLQGLFWMKGLPLDDVMVCLSRGF
jgi:hypothetical protein